MRSESSRVVCKPSSSCAASTRSCTTPVRILFTIPCAKVGVADLMRRPATLFKEIGFNQPTAVGLIISGTNFIFTLFALQYIDIIGRRKIMVWTAPGMIVGLVLASVAFHCTSLPLPLPLITLSRSLSLIHKLTLTHPRLPTQSSRSRPAATSSTARNTRTPGPRSSSSP